MINLKAVSNHDMLLVDGTLHDESWSMDFGKSANKNRFQQFPPIFHPRRCLHWLCTIKLHRVMWKTTDKGRKEGVLGVNPPTRHWDIYRSTTVFDIGEHEILIRNRENWKKQKAQLVNKLKSTNQCNDRLCTTSHGIHDITTGNRNEPMNLPPSVQFCFKIILVGTVPFRE